MTSEPNIVRVLRQEEKNGKLRSKFSIENNGIQKSNNSK